MQSIQWLDELISTKMSFEKIPFFPIWWVRWDQRNINIHSYFFRFIFATEQVVDVSKDNSNDAYAYIADMSSYGLVVYSFYRNKYWRVGHQFFHFDPMGGNINANKVNMVLNYGIFGLALGKPDSNKYKNMFHSIWFVLIFPPKYSRLNFLLLQPSNRLFSCIVEHERVFRTELRTKKWNASDKEPKFVLRLCVSWKSWFTWTIGSGILWWNYQRSFLHENHEKFAGLLVVKYNVHTK